jgi:AcrR family transcriptional regulator
MRRIAAELGTSYQVVYSRIGDKASVVRALHDDGMARLTDVSTKRIDVEPGCDAHLVALGQAYIDMAIDNPALFEVMFGVPIAEFERDDAARKVEWQGFRKTWVAACQAWLDARYDPRPRGSSVRLAWRLWTAVHGITVLHLAGHDSPSGKVHDEIAAVIALHLREPFG